MDKINATIKLIVDGGEKKFRKADGMIGMLKAGQSCIVQIEIPADSSKNVWVFKKPWVGSKQVIQPLKDVAFQKRKAGSVYEFKTHIHEANQKNKPFIGATVTWPQENHVFILKAYKNSDGCWNGGFDLWEIALVGQKQNFFVRVQRMMSPSCYRDKKTNQIFCPDINESDPSSSTLLDFLGKTVFPDHSVLAIKKYFQTKYNKFLRIEPGMGIVKFFNPATGIGCAACNIDDETCKEDLVDVRLVWSRMPIDPDSTEFKEPHYKGLRIRDIIKIEKFAPPDQNHPGIVYNKTSFAIEAYGQYVIIKPELK